MKKLLILGLLAFSIMTTAGCGKKSEENAEGKTEETKTEEKSAEGGEKKEGEKAEGAKGEGGEGAVVSDSPTMYSVEDLTVNTLGSGGNHILIASFTLEVKKPDQKAELAEKKFMLNDIMLRVFGSKTIGQLSSSYYKDTLKVEIAERIKNAFPKVKVKNVYFTKYILQ